ncbi:hypothetical protein [Candidatus Spongiisocius sp.]|uniref:hypothetical protein n=1 Tax=Candidatus Spongiisocius sp. TaxID=3101273 RepID=UPI003B59C40E
MSGLVDRPRGYDLETLHEMGSPDEGAAGAVVALRPLIEAARPRTAATHVTALSADGAYSASIPLTDAMALGEVHADPADRESILRLRVPGGMTLCWNVKDLGLLRVTAGPEPDSLPEILTH